MPTLFVPAEKTEGERRVAVTPDITTRWLQAGVDVQVESGAGSPARYRDEDYAKAGAEIIDDPARGWGSADIVGTVRGPTPAQARQLRADAVVVGFLAAHRNLETVSSLAGHGVTTLAMELVPRISRAQSMDALSSQANIAGYRAAVEAAARLEKVMPLFMTAAGTVRPATVVVLGTGVAGLQAIATARRLGAVVRANDIRPAAREEVESLGAEFIDVQADDGDAQDAGGYAREVGEDAIERQRRILTDHLAQAHAVITTAVVPGKPAPTLVTAEMVDHMPDGSVLIDLAASEGGNCELTDGEGEREHGGVTVVGASELASSAPSEASSLYARNVFELVTLMLADGEVNPRVDDEVITSATLTRGGDVVHQPTAELLAEADTDAADPARKEAS